MCRVNIEASAALAEWIDLYREEPAVYEQLVLRAVAYLPMPSWKPGPTGTQFAMLALPEVREQMTRKVPELRLAKVRADAEAHAGRVFSNALLNSAWRNGPVEEIHAGTFKDYPLDKRKRSTHRRRGAHRRGLRHGQIHGRDGGLPAARWGEASASVGRAGRPLRARRGDAHHALRLEPHGGDAGDEAAEGVERHSSCPPRELEVDTTDPARS